MSQWRTAMGLKPTKGPSGYGLAAGTYARPTSANVDTLKSFSTAAIATAYTQARNGTGTLQVGGTKVAGSTYSSIKGGQAYVEFDQMFLEFDTYTSGTITAATLSIYVTATTGTSGSILCGLYDYGTSVTTADWIPGASVPSTLASIAQTSFSTLNILYTLTSSGLAAAVNTAGFTRLVLFSSQTASSTATVGFQGLATCTLANCVLNLTIA